ncbi:unnamed protein product, partial [Rotaria sordida]
RKDYTYHIEIDEKFGLHHQENLNSIKYVNITSETKSNRRNYFSNVSQLII